METAVEDLSLPTRKYTNSIPYKQSPINYKDGINVSREDSNRALLETCELSPEESYGAEKLLESIDLTPKLEPKDCGLNEKAEYGFLIGNPLIQKDNAEFIEVRENPYVPTSPVRKIEFLQKYGIKIKKFFSTVRDKLYSLTLNISKKKPKDEISKLFAEGALPA